MRDDRWETELAGGILIRKEVPCGQGGKHYWIRGDKVSVCTYCAGHGTVVWATVLTPGEFFRNCATAGALARAHQEGRSEATAKFGRLVAAGWVFRA